MTKDLKHYMALPYRMEITPIPEDEGGGFSACLPELGRYACVADGDSTEEAVANLLALKEQIFFEYLDRSVEIPEPRDQDL